MSKLTIKYIDERSNTRDITGVDIKVTNSFLELTVKEDEKHYIPLCNIKEFVIDGHNSLKGKVWINIEIHKISRNKINTIYFEDGDAIKSMIIAPYQVNCQTDNELIEKIKELLTEESVSYKV